MSTYKCKILLSTKRDHISQKCSYIFTDWYRSSIYILQTGTETKLEKAQITLNDCLACSGCITSAESVLITQQSQDELYRVLQENLCLEKVNYIWATMRESLSSGFVNIRGVDQPAHPQSLISAFVIRFLESLISKLATSDIPIF